MQSWSRKDQLLVSYQVVTYLCCGFISHLIGCETINIPEIFSGVHGFPGKTVKEICSKVRKWSKVNVPLFPNIPKQFPFSLEVILNYNSSNILLSRDWSKHVTNISNIPRLKYALEKLFASRNKSMSADKYPSIFSRQMEAVVYISLVPLGYVPLFPKTPGRPSTIATVTAFAACSSTFSSANELESLLLNTTRQLSFSHLQFAARN